MSTFEKNAPYFHGPPKFTVRLNGHQTDEPELHVGGEFAIQKAFELSGTARGSILAEKVDFTEQLVGLKTQDGVEWYGLGPDLPDVTGQPATADRSGNTEFHLPTAIVGQDASRGFLGDVLTSLFKIARRGAHKSLGSEVREQATEWLVDELKDLSTDLLKTSLARNLGEEIDQYLCPQPGLYRITEQGNLGGHVTNVATERKILVFLHGTFSSFTGGFGGMGADTWQQLHDAYDGHLYALDHRTITVSPIANAITLLQALPTRAEVDLISHSRGGLVGDVLARCDGRLQTKAGYSAEEIAVIRKEMAAAETGYQEHREHIEQLEDLAEAVAGGFGLLAKKLFETRRSLSTLAKEMADVTTLAEGKDVRVGRFVRVACPAAGTTLLSERLDHWLNALLNLLKQVFGPGGAVLVDLVRRLLLAVLDERADAAVFPGIYAMVPGAGFTRINDDSTLRLPCELINIAGNSEVGPTSALHSLFTILSNLYYLQANDFVVDTASMSRGLHLRQRNTTLLIKNDAIHHSAYFAHVRHRKYVLQLLLHGNLGELEQAPDVSYFDTVRDRTDQGKLVNKILEPGELPPSVVSGERPIVLLLPGIMGSNLSVDGDQKWFQLDQLADGALVQSLGEGAVVETPSVASDYYEDLQNHLVLQGYDARAFPYDWRLSLENEATRLNQEITSLLRYGQSVTIVAHSMGGLLFRQLMFDYPDTWHQLRDRHEAKLLLLGTPWRGSHLITETLTGLGSRIKQLALVDLQHGRDEVLATVQGWYGLYQLLPLDDGNLANPEWWETQRRLVNWVGMPSLPTPLLERFAKFRAEVAKQLTKLTEQDWSRVYYVAGLADKTVDGYRRRFNIFALRDTLQFTATPRGDGSVTWARGIPRGIAAENVYYTQTPHAELPNDDRLFGGLMDIIRHGTTRTSAFRRVPPVGTTRGGSGANRAAEKLPTAVPAGTSYEIVMGNARGTRADVNVNVRVRVFNSDLRWAAHPVLVGHYAHDGIVSAERAIDAYLGGVLSERHRFGFYPSNIGEQLVIVHPNHNPRGTVVVGLGDKDDLTSSTLSRTVEKGVLHYVLFRRDNLLNEGVLESGGYGISTLFIGTIYGLMPLRESINAILRGVRTANKLIAAYNKEENGSTLYPITELEFVDYYEDRVYEAFKSLQELQSLGSLPEVQLAARIHQGFRRRKRILREASRSWWQNLSTTVERDGPDGRQYLEFRTYTRGSSVNKQLVKSSFHHIRRMADRLSTEDQWDERYAKALFETLIPNAYKDFIRNNRNLTWRMDAEAAALPWELFHDSDFGSEPTFVRAGMVRQLLGEETPVRAKLVRERNCLVVARSTFGEGLPDLPQAREEGRLVRRLMLAEGYKVPEYEDLSSLDLHINTFVRGYKMMHFASHGVYDPKGLNTGIVLDADWKITPEDFDQLDKIPELVFVNCCYLGKIAPAQKALREGRHRLAANLGTQLIKIGVKAVVVAGWAVNDAAAYTFANTFYQRLLSGAYFGNAVREARKACYDQFGNTNTWGAYQCYGDPFYRTELAGRTDKTPRPPSLTQEVILEVENLVARAESLTGEPRVERAKIIDAGRHLIAEAGRLGLVTPAVREREAELYSYLGRYDEALDRYESLFADQNAWGGYKLLSHLNYYGIKVHHIFQKANGRDRDAYKTITDIIARTKDRYHPDNERLANYLLGGMHYFAASVGRHRQQKSQLKAAARYYLATADSFGLMSVGGIESVANYILIVTLHNAALPLESQLSEEKELGVSAEAYFEHWADLLTDDPEDLDSLQEVRQRFTLETTRLIYASVVGGAGDAELRSLADQALVSLRWQLGYAVNLRDLLRAELTLRAVLVLLGTKDANYLALRAELERVISVLHGLRS